MTRKHFKALADMLRDARLARYDDAQQAIDAIERDMMRMCARENGNFDAGRFRKAAQP